MAETYTINTNGGKFFVEIVFYKWHKNVYKNSSKVIDYLNKSNIDFINKNISTKNNKFTSKFENGVLGIFKYEKGSKAGTIKLYKPKFSKIKKEKSNW